MGDRGAVEEDDLDWEHVLDAIPEAMTDLFQEPYINPPAAVEGFANHSPDSVTSWIGIVEHLLMKDDDGDDEVLVDSNSHFCSDFLSDILLDSPAAPSADDLEESPADKNSSSSEYGGPEKKNVIDVPDRNNEDDKNKSNTNSSNSDDVEAPISKKQRRRLRNRDAALRSRERKKVYVKDLEMKSRYLEGECIRLGRLLQCCSAENQSLRIQLYNNKGFGAPTPKQESAVLVLESLLLGSLLWFLGIACLFPLPRLAQSIREEIPQESAGGRVVEIVLPRRARSKIIPLQASISLRRRRCRASRTKMRSISLAAVVLV